MLWNGENLDFMRFSGIEKVHRNSIKITVDLWRRARDFFGALPCAFASLRSLTTSAKTVHRTVFFRRQRLLPPCSNPSLFILPMQKAGVETCGLFIFVGTQASISVPPWNLNVIRPSDRAEFFMASQSFLIFQSRSPRINGIADRSELSATGRVYSMNRSVIRFEYLPSSLGIPPFAIKSLSAAVSEDENLTTA